MTKQTMSSSIEFRPIEAHARILIINHNYLGDQLMTSPLIYNLRKKYPEAVIAACIGNRGKAIVSLTGGIDHWIYRKNYDRFWNVGPVIKAIRAFKPDVVIDIRNSFWTHLMAHRSGASRIVILGTKPLVHGLKAEIVPLPAKRPHMSDCAEAVGVYLGLIPYEHKIIFNEMECGERHGAAIFLPGTTRPSKEWISEYWIELGKMIVERTGKRVIVLGAAADKHLCEYFTDRTIFDDRIGQTSLTDLCCMMRNASLIITLDNGALHIADYCDLPGVALFGPTDFRFAGPKYPKIAVVEPPEYTCKTVYCNKMKCKYPPWCMSRITPKQVFDAAMEKMKV